MKPEILLIEPMMPDVEAQLDAAYQVHRLFQASNRAAFVADIGPRVRAIVTGGRTGASNDLLDAMPELQIIAINGIGTDAVDLERARARGIRVTTTPDVLTDDVADLAIGLLLAAARRICVGDRFVRAGRWPSGGPPLATKVSGKRLGILGLGRVGRAIARRAEGFALPMWRLAINQTSRALPASLISWLSRQPVALVREVSSIAQCSMRLGRPAY